MQLSKRTGAGKLQGRWSRSKSAIRVFKELLTRIFFQPKSADEHRPVKVVYYDRRWEIIFLRPVSNSRYLNVKLISRQLESDSRPVRIFKSRTSLLKKRQTR